MNPQQKAELQKNTRVNLIHTLEDWSDQERQLKYKQAVPFVHVPRELLARWDEYSSLLKETRQWFVESFNEREITAITSFDRAIAAFNRDNQLPDVPEVFRLPEWLALMSKASELLRILGSN